MRLVQTSKGDHGINSRRTQCVGLFLSLARLEGKSAPIGVLVGFCHRHVCPLDGERRLGQDVVDGGLVEAGRVQLDPQRRNVLRLVHQVVEARSKAEESVGGHEETLHQVAVEGKVEARVDGLRSLSAQWVTLEFGRLLYLCNFTMPIYL